MTSERDGLKAKLRKNEMELEQIKTENQGFREERDRLRRRVSATFHYTNGLCDPSSGGLNLAERVSEFEFPWRRFKLSER